MKNRPAKKTPSLDQKALRFPSKTIPAEKGWQNLATRLALVLADLDEDEFLIVSEKKRTVYVQFSAQGWFGTRVEAVGPALLDSDLKLSKEDKKTLRALGWRRPTFIQKPGAVGPPDGSCNYYADVDSSSFSLLADLAVRTLREVYHTRHPGDLQYRAFGAEGYDIRFPTLGLKRMER